MTDGQNFFDQPVRHKLLSSDIIRKIATGQGDDYTNGYFFFFFFFFFIIFAPCKAEQPLRGMELQEKEAQIG